MAVRGQGGPTEQAAGRYDADLAGADAIELELPAIDGAARWSNSQADLDGFPAPAFTLADTLDTTESEQWSGFSRVRLKALGLNHQFSVSASDIVRDTVSDFPSRFEADRQVYRWQADGQSGDTLNYAFGVEREETSGRRSSRLLLVPKKWVRPSARSHRARTKQQKSPHRPPTQQPKQTNK